MRVSSINSSNGYLNFGTYANDTVRERAKKILCTGDFKALERDIVTVSSNQNGSLKMELNEKALKKVEKELDEARVKEFREQADEWIDYPDEEVRLGAIATEIIALFYPNMFGYKTEGTVRDPLREHMQRNLDMDIYR